MLNKQTMRQRGFFRCGAGINKRQWIENAKAEGYATLDCGEHVELWSDMTPSEKSSGKAV